MKEEVATGLPSRNTSNNQGVTKKHPGAARLELNALGDGNCAFNAFILALYASVKQHAITLDSPEFNQFLKDLNSYLVNEYQLDGLAETQNGREGFLALVAQLEQKYPFSYLTELQKAAAPLLRQIAVTAQINSNYDLDLITMCLTAATIIYRKSKYIVEGDNESVHAQHHDHFDGIESIDKKFSEFTNEYMATQVDLNNITYDAIHDWVCNSQKVTTYLAQTAKPEYHKNLAQDGISVGSNTLSILAKTFKVSSAFHTILTDEKKIKDAQKETPETLRYEIQTDNDTTPRVHQFLQREGHEPNAIELSNSGNHWVVLLPENTENQALANEYATQKADYVQQKTQSSGESTTSKVKSTCSDNIKFMITQSPIYQHAKTEMKDTVADELEHLLSGDFAKAPTKREGQSDEQYKQELADFKFAKSLQLEEIENYKKSFSPR